MIKAEAVEAQLISNAHAGMELQTNIKEIASKFNIRKEDIEVVAYAIDLIPAEQFWGPSQRRVQ